MASVSAFLTAIFTLAQTASPLIFFDPDLAAEKFRADVARTYAIKPEAITIQPEKPGVPNTCFFDLGFGNLYAYQARFVVNGEKAMVNGYASIGGVETVLVKSAVGLAPLLDEARVFNAGETMPLDQLVARLAFVLHGHGETADHPDAPWRLERTGAAVTISYLAILPGTTGSAIVRRVSIKATPGQRPEISVAPFAPKTVPPRLKTVELRPWFGPGTETGK